MKNIFFILIFFFAVISVYAQDSEKKNRKELKAEKKAQRIEEINNLLKIKTFVFNATNAQPMSGGSIPLNYFFNAEINGDSIKSYLPFYGVAYHVEYGSRTSPFDFELPISNYLFEQDKKGYHIKFEVKNKMDVINFAFHISDLGYASLNITSTNRQVMSFYGTIEEIEKKE
ncbi:MAG: DUF4251 domain-containing protein [Bacteroidetes bacterium]|nr:DUF4251 domain-containing protein [Bacteroidota bacterium]